MSEMGTSELQLQGLVAQIINAREMAINIGADHGVKLGMKFAVLAATPIEIRDPQTQELLDTVDREKVRVEAVMVRHKVTICRTYRKKLMPGGLLYTGAFADLARPPREVVETLKAEDSALPEPLSENESYVKIGDPVVFVSNERD